VAQDANGPGTGFAGRGTGDAGFAGGNAPREGFPGGHAVEAHLAAAIAGISDELGVRVAGGAAWTLKVEITFSGLARAGFAAGGTGEKFDFEAEINQKGLLAEAPGLAQ
jgi:hypothetical protein